MDHARTSTTTASIAPVAIARTPFQEKFGIPRQPNLAPHAQGTIELLPPYNQPAALEGLEQYSHVWLVFLFDCIQSKANLTAKTPALTVRPPRLGGNQRIGVFASRSTHRPNALGQSVVRLTAIEGTRLFVSGLDLLDRTPIIDIKPYVPYADAQSEATSTLAPEAPPTLALSWSPEAQQRVKQYEYEQSQPLEALITECLAQDPRPAYHQDAQRVYGMRLWDVNVQFCFPDETYVHVLDVSPA